MGVVAALAIITAWLCCVAFSLAMPLPLAAAPLQIALITFLSTGLFITAHDAMHGTVAPRSPRLNDLLGAVAVRLYALFSYRKLRTMHAAHHTAPGHVGDDPDYHDGAHPNFWRWYLHFIRNYLGAGQLVGMAIAYNVLAHAAKIPEPRLIAFWVAPALLSTLQLFYFGTYLPHRGGDFADAHRARSNDFPPWLSLLTCYHFGYHHEHHERPGLAWWQLPAYRSGKM